MLSKIKPIYLEEVRRLLSIVRLAFHDGKEYNGGGTYTFGLTFAIGAHKHLKALWKTVVEMRIVWNKWKVVSRCVVVYYWRCLIITSLNISARKLWGIEQFSISTAPSGTFLNSYAKALPDQTGLGSSPSHR
jgi:hypothetical protein